MVSVPTELEGQYRISNFTLRFNDAKIQNEFNEYLREEVLKQTCILMAVFFFLSLATLVMLNISKDDEDTKKLL